MVLQVLADPGQVVAQLDAEGLELVLITDAGEQQQLRRTEGTGTEDHFLGGMADLLDAIDLVLHPDRGLAGEHQAGDEGAAFHHQVVAPGGRVQVATRGAPALALVGRGLGHVDSFLALAVLVRVQAQAVVLAGAEEGLVQRVVGLAAVHV